MSHYHQRAGSHPNSSLFENEDQCIELVTSGRGWVRLPGGWTEVGAGDLLWHLPGDRTIERSDFKDPYRCLAVRFREGPLPRRDFARLTRWEDIDEVNLFTRQVVHLHADGGFDTQVLLRYILARVRFQAELYRRVHAERRLPVELQRVLELIKHHYGEPLKLSGLARASGWSVAHLHEQFKNHLGLSPHQAIIRRRLQAAREILASTNEPLKSVAARCGFPTASAFCVQFKRNTQLSPKEYRNRQLFGGHAP